MRTFGERSASRRLVPHEWRLGREWLSGVVGRRLNGAPQLLDEGILALVGESNAIAPRHICRFGSAFDQRELLKKQLAKPGAMTFKLTAQLRDLLDQARSVRFEPGQMLVDRVAPRGNRPSRLGLRLGLEPGRRSLGLGQEFVSGALRRHQRPPSGLLRLGAAGRRLWTPRLNLMEANEELIHDRRHLFDECVNVVGVIAPQLLAELDRTDGLAAHLHGSDATDGPPAGVEPPKDTSESEHSAAAHAVLDELQEQEHD